MGYHVHILASMNYVGRTSMVVGVKVISENPITGESRITTKAYLTFVALDDQGKPVPVPGLVPVTEEDHRRIENAKLRMAGKKKLRGELRSK
jgi:acyl-CoA hydrolase